MPSSLGRMFALASAQQNAAIENFTTEALAAVIRDDPEPLLVALRDVAVPAAGRVHLVETQVPIDGGQLDLLVEVDAMRVAIEVKVDAGPSGDDQLDRYLAWVERDPARRCLVILARHDIRAERHAPRASWLSWRALRDAARSHRRWHDLLLWLKERRMADDFDGPITSDEARSLGDAHALLHKTARLLVPACAHLANIWPAPKWPTDEDAILERVAARFAKWPSYTIDSGRRLRAGVTLGVYFEDGEPWLGVWVWANPKRIEERDRIARVGLQLTSARAHWQADPASWELLGAYARWESVADASAWWIARADELHRVAMFAAIEGTGRAESDEEGP